jgi:3-hydroxyisobutyrate dehydrogenase
VAAATREALQAHFGIATLQDDPEAYLRRDFSALLETVALQAGISLESEDVAVDNGLDTTS